MKLVKFLKPYKSYNEGDLAGFDSDVADALIAVGLAELVRELSSGVEKAPVTKKA